eukprot:gene35250-43464_t
MCKYKPETAVNTLKDSTVKKVPKKKQQTKRAESTASTGTAGQSPSTDPSTLSPVASLLPSSSHQAAVRERIREMFVYSYDSYMIHAYPEAELKSLSCEGG